MSLFSFTSFCLARKPKTSDSAGGLSFPSQKKQLDEETWLLPFDQVKLVARFLVCLDSFPFFYHGFS